MNPFQPAERQAPLFSFQNSKEWLEAIVRSSEDAIIGKSLQETIVSWNDAASEIYGYTAEEIIGQSVAALIPPERKAELADFLTKIAHGQKIDHYETTRVRKDGTAITVSIGISPVKDPQGTIIGASTIARDITPLKKLQDELLKKNDELKKSYPRLILAEQLFDNAADGIVITDTRGIVQMVNTAFLHSTGYTLDELMGRTLGCLRSNHHDDAFYQTIWQTLQTKGQWAGEIWNKKKNGEVYPDWLSISSIPDNTGKTMLYTAIYRNLAERMKYEQELRYQAFHDALTGLPNRLLFQQELENRLTAARQNEQLLAVCFLDLDGFKGINDTLGHDIGDLLLQAVAQRLTNALRSTDLVARMGGDEFTIILTDFHHREAACGIAAQIIDIIRQPYRLADHAVQITTSIGISFYPQHGQDVQTLMKLADIAMYTAKNSGKNKCCIYQTGFAEK